MSKSKVFIFLEYIKFSTQVNDPMYIHAYLPMGSKFSKETGYQVMDAENTLSIQTEVCIPLKIKPDTTRKKIFILDLFRKKLQTGEKKIISTWRINMNGMPSNSVEEQRFSESRLLIDNTVTTLYFRQYIDYSNRFQSNHLIWFEQFMAWNRPEQLMDTQKVVDQPKSIFEERLTPVVSIPSRPPPVTVQAQPPPKPETKPPPVPKQKPPKPIVIDDFTIVLNQQEQMLYEIQIDQCRIKFAPIVFRTIVHPKDRFVDYSQQLLDPLINFNIFSNPILKEKEFFDLMDPFMKALAEVMNSSLSIPNLFALLGTIMNFGVKLAEAAGVYTSVHIPFLHNLAPHITKIMYLLNQQLVAALATSISDNVSDFADEASLMAAEHQSRLYVQLAIQLQIPSLLIQQIFVDSCKTIDILLYNMIIQTIDVYDAQMVKTLVARLRDIQSMYQCMSQNFKIAFENVLKFIQICENFIGKPEIERIQKKGKLVRFIAERIEPKIVLPKQMTFDDLGKQCKMSKLLITKRPEPYQFTFEWLIEKCYVSFLDS